MNATGHIRKRRNKSEDSYQLIIETSAGKDGKRNRIYKTVKGTKKQAEAVLRQTIVEIETQTYISPSKLTVKDWMNLYIIWKRSVTTIEGYWNQINNYLIPVLGDIYL